MKIIIYAAPEQLEKHEVKPQHKKHRTKNERETPQQILQMSIAYGLKNMANIQQKTKERNQKSNPMNEKEILSMNTVVIKI